MSKQKIIIITGATAIGKSSLAVRLAHQINGEIISADSMQIYRGMDIGTGKISASEMDNIAHYLIDIKNPNESYSVSEYAIDAKQKICKIINGGKIPIIVGGTGLYINAIINGHNFAQAEKSDEIRNKYNLILQEKGKEHLYQMLKIIDYKSCEKISQNDTKRVIRALEIFEITGQPKSEVVNIRTESEFDYKLIVLDDERASIYNRINARVDKMFEIGLIDEVKKLEKYRDCQSMKAIGYKEIISFFDNKIDLDGAKDKIKQNSRNYAKRQQTYFRGLRAEKIWVSCHEFDKILSILHDFI